MGVVHYLMWLILYGEAASAIKSYLPARLIELQLLPRPTKPYFFVGSYCKP